MPNVIASGTTVVNGTIKRNNFLIGVNTSLQYGPTSATTFWNGIVPSDSGYTVYAQKTVNGPSIRSAANDAELITIAKQYGGTNITTISDALSYFNGQSNFLVTNIDYPNIVTSGFTLMLDAGYIPSYPTTGTTWNDLSGNNINGTLTNGPTFNTSNGGSLVFNGNNQYINCGTPSLPSGNISVFSWIYPTSFNNEWNIICTKWFNPNGSDFHWALKSSTANGTNLRQNLYTTSNSDIYGTTAFSTNTWYYVGFTLVNGGTLTFYKNGVTDGTNSSVSRTPQSNTLQINDDRTFPNGLIGRIPQTSIYDRALSSTEVLQNYNAQKSRFGL